MPHAMIAAFEGDTVAATLAFARYLREQGRDAGVIKTAWEGEPSGD